MWSGDRLAPDSCGRTAIGGGAAGGEVGGYGRRVGGDARPAPVQYGSRPGGAPAVVATLSSPAAGVETRSLVPVFRRAG